MAKEIKRLAEAFAAKDQVEGFLSNLEKLKVDGSVTEDLYTTTKEEYEQRLDAATSAIEQIKNTLKKQLETTQRDIETYRFELGKLEAKYKVGELPLERYRSSDRKLRATIERLGQHSERLTRFIKTDSVADIGAPRKKPGVAAPRLPSLPEAAILAKKIKLPEGRRLVGMIGGAVVLISIIILAVVLLPSGPKDEAGFPPEQYETGEVTIPVNIEGAANVGSLHFELVYDWEVLCATDAEKGIVVGDAMFQYSVDVPARVIIGIIDSDGINGSGSIAMVTFQIRGETKMPISLNLDNIAAHDAANMSEIQAIASAGSFTAIDDFKAPSLLFAR